MSSSRRSGKRAQLRRAVPLAYPASSLQAVVTRHLLDSSSSDCGGSYVSSLSDAAAAAGVSTRDLATQLASDACFSMQCRQGEMLISLDATELLACAKSANALAALPPPASLTAGRHPQRPGQPVCAHFKTHRACSFGVDCVYDHPPQLLRASGERPPPEQAAVQAQLMRQQLPPAAELSPQGYPQHPGQPVCRHYERRGSCWLKEHCKFHHPPEPWQPGAPPHAPHPALQGRRSSDGGGSGSVRSSSGVGIADTQATALEQVAPGDGDSSAGGRAPPPRRPGAPPCLLYLTRGVCPSGPACRYDHPPAGPAPQTAGAGAGQAANTDEEAQHEQQQQHQQQHHQRSPPVQQGAISSISSSSARKRPGNGAVVPIAGRNAEGMPLRPGALNCRFYLYCGTCSFAGKCVFHHPEDPPLALHYVQSGGMTKRWPADEPAPFVLLLHRLGRVWDYDASPVAQLKTWLARLLLMQGNPSAQVWTRSAAAPAARDPGGLGPYSMPLAQAGALLRWMWGQQPGGVQAAGEFPFTTLRALLVGDPLFELLPDAEHSTRMHVRLDVAAIKESLNW